MPQYYSTLQKDIKWLSFEMVNELLMFFLKNANGMKAKVKVKGSSKLLVYDCLRTLLILLVTMTLKTLRTEALMTMTFEMLTRGRRSEERCRRGGSQA